ncbi:MAG TPA: hypothetical protein VFE65_28895 [Pseudonocardia sp.]|nr:hypothetical protein [Pseudonocardia sp.]
MNIKKLLGFVAILFVLFWVISAPGSASGSVNNMMTNLKGAGYSMTHFMGGVLGTGGGDDYSGSYDNGRSENGRYDNGRYNDSGHGNSGHQHNRY